MTEPRVRRGIRSTQVGLFSNAVLAVVKVVTGIVGHSQALIADGIESSADVFSSLVVWSGLRISARSADDDYPFGYGKAEALAALAVGLLLFIAATAIAIESVHQIVTPHRPPRSFTLAVLVAVVLVKEVLFRRVVRIGADVGSTAVQADAWHHRSDAITSAAAFIGISVALIGGPGWEAADDWAALLASGIIVYNAIGVVRPATHDLMDRAPGEEMVSRVASAATTVPGVCAIEKLKVRKAGMGYYVDLHVQADPAMPLHAAHVLSGMVKSAIRQAVPEVAGALIHMEPYEGEQ
jgi:cation diffusion facilitator family transporter